MQAWYYHSPGQGRVGPLSAEQIQQHYRQRLMTLDTLVWREGMREWQPAERLIEELGLIDVKPDASLPPPVPPSSKSLGITQVGDTRFGAAANAPAESPRAKLGLSELEPRMPPPKKGMHGCLIAAIVIGVLGLIAIAFIAALAIPAYNDYVKRAKAARNGAQIDQPQTFEFDADKLALNDRRVRMVLAEAMQRYYRERGHCPDEQEFESVYLRYDRWVGPYTMGQVNAEASDHCAYHVLFRELGPQVDNKITRYDVSMNGEEANVVCAATELPAGFQPPGCG